MKGLGVIIGENQGCAEVIVEKDRPIVGSAVIGPSAGEMINELMYAVGFQSLPSEAAASLHVRPTPVGGRGRDTLGLDRPQPALIDQNTTPDKTRN